MPCIHYVLTFLKLTTHTHPARRWGIATFGITAVEVVAAWLLTTSALADLQNGISEPERIQLHSDVDVPPGAENGKEKVILSVPITLQAGQSRRVSDQLTVTQQLRRLGGG